MKKLISDLKNNAHDRDLCLSSAHVIHFNRGTAEMFSVLLSDLDGTITVYYNDNLPNIILCSGLTANYLVLKYPDWIKQHCHWEHFEERILSDLHASGMLSRYGYICVCVENAAAGMKPLDITEEKADHLKSLDERGYFESRPRIP